MARQHPVRRVVFLRQQKSLTILSEFTPYLINNVTDSK